MRGWRWAGLGLLLMATSIGWLAGQARQTAPEAGQGAAAPRAASGVAASAKAASPARASASLPGPPAASATAQADERSRLMQRMKADWCGFGLAEYGRQTDAVMEAAKARGNGEAGPEVFSELQETAGQAVVDEAIEQARERWVKALLQRGDLRSRAAAEFIRAAGPEGDPARARLHALARTTSDPMVTALALQRPCAAGSCHNIEASQWSRLEPANLQAWLTLMRDPAGKSQASYVLDRLIHEVRYSRSYEREFQDLLLSLPQTTAPGLQNEAEIQLITGMVSAWILAPVKPILDICRGDAASGSRCEAVARLLWQQDEYFNRAIALAIVRLQVAARPATRGQWEAQAREFEAVGEWSQGALGRSVGRLTADTTSRCGWQSEMRKTWQEAAGRGEWQGLRAEMREAGEDEAQLAARWRQREGRSALDPRPPARPASAGSR